MNAFASPMSVQTWQRDSVRSQNYSSRSSAYNAPYYARSQPSVGLNAKQANNPNPRVIPAPIPTNLVPYRKEESLKKLTEDNDPVDINNPQYKEFLAKRGKSNTTKRPSVSVQGLILICNIFSLLKASNNLLESPLWLLFFILSISRFLKFWSDTRLPYRQTSSCSVFFAFLWLQWQQLYFRALVPEEAHRSRRRSCCNPHKQRHLEKSKGCCN